MLQFDLYSFADVRHRGLLEAVGRAFDADPRLRLERIDVRDPIRHKVTSAEAYFAEFGGRIEKDDFLFERRQEPAYGGLLSAVSYRLPLPDSAHELGYLFEDAADAWLGEPDNLEAAAALFVRLAGAFDGAYGSATDPRMWRQHMSEMVRVGMAEGVQYPNIGPFTDAYALRDVYWLNYFGPAFVEPWTDRLVDLGVRQRPTENGGLVVWATATPFVYDPNVESFMSYAWKQPFYERLGRDSFYHPGQPPGQYVPTRADHLRRLSGSTSAPGA